MIAHVLLNLLNELGKRDIMRGLPSILSLFRTEFNKFNKTGARMLDSIHPLSLKSHFCHKNVTICHHVRNAVMDVIAFPLNLYTTNVLSILMHGFISHSNATSYDKVFYAIT